MNAFREGNNKMRVTDEMKEMIRLSNILKEESGLSFSEVMEMLKVSAIRDLNDTLYDISDTIDRLGDNLTYSINAIEEDIRTGKAFVKGEISTYNLN